MSSTPYRQTGKLIMTFGVDDFICTTSLVKPGVLVTAAHCVHEFCQGNAGFADRVAWIPANTDDPFVVSDPGPFGVWEAVAWYIPFTYYNGADTCAKTAPGVVCNNDLALVVLETKAGQTAGQALGGYYGYGTNGYGFVKTPAFKNAIAADITQLGYPAVSTTAFRCSVTTRLESTSFRRPERHRASRS